MQMLLDTMTADIAGERGESLADGEGVRYVIYFQGCSHHCQGCHNAHTWPINHHMEEKLQNIFERMSKIPKWYQGITLSGGEPFEQEEAAYMIAREAQTLGFDVWTYTGYLYEKLRDSHRPLLEMTDVLVDGPYMREMQLTKQRKMHPKVEYNYRGSSNQRIINLKEARKTGCIMVDGEEIFVPRREPLPWNGDRNEA